MGSTLRMILGQEVEKTGPGIYHIILDVDRAELTGKTSLIFPKMISSTVIVCKRTGLEQNLSATLEDLMPSLSSAAEAA